jgi:hypothetical protein
MNLLTPDEIANLPGTIKNFDSLADVPAGFAGNAFILNTGQTISGDGVNLWPQAASSLRNTNVKVAFFGDSTASVISGASNQLATVNTRDISKTNITFATLTSGVGLVSEKNQLSTFYPQALPVLSFGYSGNSTTDMLARDTAVASLNRMATADISSTVDCVIFRGGSINNLLAISTPENYITVLATTLAEHKTLLNRLLSRGVIVIDELIFGYGTVGTVPGLIQNAVVAFKAAMIAYIKTLSNAYYIDCTDVLCDSNGVYLSGVTGDGTHLNVGGAYALSRLEGSLLDAIYGKSANSRYLGTNLFTNNMFANTGSSGTGTVATGVTFGAIANCALANAKIEQKDGLVYQTVEVTPSASANTLTATFAFNPTTMSILATDIMGFEVSVIIDGVDSSAPTPTNSRARVDLYNTLPGRTVYEMATNNTRVIAAQQVKENFIFVPIKMNEVSANFTTSSSFVYMFLTDSLLPYKLWISVPKIVKL